LPQLERITLKCLQKSPDRRCHTARDLLVDLQNLARELEQGPAAFAPALFSRLEATTSFAGDRGRVIFPVADVDALHACAGVCRPTAPWGRRMGASASSL